MPIPEPRPGLVIRYDYLWSREAAGGRDGGKDRPACLVAATKPADVPRYVVILPITHSQPDADTPAVEIPERVRQALGLDEDRSWVILSEHNVDEWPNGGLSAVPGRPGEFAYGFIPPKLFRQIRDGFLELARRGRSGRVRR